MNIGLLRVSARFTNGRIDDIRVLLNRPPVTRLLLGQLPEKGLAVLPLVYSLCGQAHGLAARSALAAARGDAAPVEDPRPLWREIQHERLWRLLLDWPAALGLPPATDAFKQWRLTRGGEDLALATTQLLAETLVGHTDPGAPPTQASLAGRCLARLGADADAASACPPPSLAPETWLAACLGEAPLVPPAHPPSPAAAYAALLAATRQDACSHGPDSPYPLAMAGRQGVGAAQTLTARGILSHTMRLENGLVSDYHVLAPTDARFADGACLARLLAKVRCADGKAARREIALAILALDPCVPHVVELNDA